jgi:hypothetical protein
MGKMNPLAGALAQRFRQRGNVVAAVGAHPVVARFTHGLRACPMRERAQQHHTEGEPPGERPESARCGYL